MCTRSSCCSPGSCQPVTLEDTYTTPAGPVAPTPLRLDDDGYLS